jgi:hypothetical protein
MPNDAFTCFNCRKEKPSEEAVSLSWPVHIGWLFVSGGLVGGVCRECKGSVTFIGAAVTLFFVVVGVAGLIYVVA